MAATTSRGRSGAITGINVTPLVDITLVLLIVFMVAAKLIVNNKGLPIDLPKAATGGEVEEVLSVVLAAPSGTQVNGATLASDDEVAGPAAQQFAKDHTVRAVIKADGRVPHERVMHVLDVLRQVGISRIAFGITPKPAAAPPAPPLTPAAQP